VALLYPPAPEHDASQEAPAVRLRRRSIVTGAARMRSLVWTLRRYPQAKWRALILSPRHLIMHVWIPRKERNAPQD
jgi:hypothetical protein